MTMSKGKSNNEFDLQGLTFQEIVLIKKACTALAGQGSTGAAQIVKDLEEAMDNTTV